MADKERESQQQTAPDTEKPRPMEQPRPRHDRDDRESGEPIQLDEEPEPKEQPAK